MNRPPDVREELAAALAEEARAALGAGPGPEPGPEELLDYLAGRLPGEAARRLERRLVADPALARELLDLEELAAAESAAATAPPDVATRAGWRDLRARLPGAARRPRATAPLALALAASLVAVVGLGVRVGQLEVEAERPIANLATLELVAGTRAGGEQAVPLAPGEWLRLALAPTERCPVYEATIAGPDAGDRRTIGGLLRDERGLVTLALPLAPGRYTLRLTGCAPGRELEVHDFRIVARDGG